MGFSTFLSILHRARQDKYSKRVEAMLLVVAADLVARTVRCQSRPRPRCRFSFIWTLETVAAKINSFCREVVSYNRRGRFISYSILILIWACGAEIQWPSTPRKTGDGRQNAPDTRQDPILPL
jgi:hypothetical protein